MCRFSASFSGWLFIRGCLFYFFLILSPFFNWNIYKVVLDSPVSVLSVTFSEWQYCMSAGFSVMRWFLHFFTSKHLQDCGMKTRQNVSPLKPIVCPSAYIAKDSNCKSAGFWVVFCYVDYFSALCSRYLVSLFIN